MTVAKKGRKQPSIRTLWAIAKSAELGMTDDDLHALVFRETGKESIRELTQGQINEVARVLQNMKDGASQRIPVATGRQWRSARKYLPCAESWAGMTTLSASRALSNALPMLTAWNG